MAKQRYVDWDGLVYYDGKIKSYIAEKMDACMRFMGDISSRNELPDPSYENLNQVFKLSTSLEIAANDTDFESSRRGAQYPAGTLVIVSDYDGVYLYDVLVQPAQNDPSVTPDLTEINERVSSIEDTLSEQDSRISDTENTIEQLGISIENTYARKDEVPSVEGLASESYVDDKVGSIIIPDVSGLASVEEVNDKVSEISDSIVETNTHISHIEEDIEAINDRALEHEKSLRDIHNLLAEKSDENHTHKTSELVNDSAFVKESQLSEYALNSSLAQYATKDYVDAAIANAEISGGDTDVEDVIKGLLGNYYTKDQTYNKSEIDAKIPHNVSELTNDAGYVTEDELNSKGYITDVSNLATKQELQDAIDDIVVPDITLDGYATEQWVKDQGYITEHQDISGKADKEHTHKLEDIVDYVAPDLNGYATKDDIKDFASKEYVSEQLDNFITAEDVPNYIPESYVTADELAEELEKIEHPTVDLTGYYTAEETDNLLKDYVQVESYEINQQIINNALNNRYNKEDADKRFALKADLNALAETVDAIEVPTKVSELTNDAGYITLAEVPTTDLSNYYNKTETENLVADAIDGIEIPEVDLTGYYTKEEVNNLIPDTSKFLEYIPEEYVTADELAAEGFIKEHQDLSNYALKSEIPTDYLKEIPAEYITETELNSKGYLTEHQDISGKADKATTLSGYGITDAYTRTEIDTKLLEIESGGKIDEETLKGFVSEDEWNERIGAYALKTDIPTDYLKEVPDEYVTEDELTTLATKEELEAVQTVAGQNSVKLFQLDSDLVDINAKLATIPTKVSELDNDAGYLTEHQSLEGYAKTSDIPDTSAFITMQDVEDKGYITEHQSLEHLATKDELNILENNIGYVKVDDRSFAEVIDETFAKKSDVEGFATEQFVTDELGKITIPTKTSELTNDSNFLTEHQDISGKADKADTYTKSEVDDLIPSLEGYAKTADIPDVSKFITEIPGEYITEDELSAKGYITSIPDEYAKKSDIPTDYVTDAELESKGYLTEHQSLDNYATKDLLNLKADSVLFKQDKWVNVAIGKFAVGDNVKDKTIAEILIGILGLTDSISPDEPEEPQGLIATIIAKELPAFCGTSESGLTATPWKTITLGDKYTELGFYSENNRNGYQLKFIGNTDLDAQVFAIPHGAKILAAYKYDLGGANEWLAQDVPPSFEWLEAGTTTVEIDGVTYTYDVYEYNVGDMGDALVVDEYWRIEIGE